MFWRSKKTTSIKAVDETDFEAFLKELGVYEQVTSAGARCVVCGNTLALDDIEAVFPKDGEVKFICSTPKCSLALANGEENA